MFTFILECGEGWSRDEAQYASVHGEEPVRTLHPCTCIVSAAPPLTGEDKTLADKTLAPAPPALCLRWTGVSAILSLTERCTCRYDGCVS